MTASEHDDGAGLKVVDDDVEVGDDECGLLVRVSGSDDRIRMNEGLRMRRNANNVAKSVSCEITIRSSPAA